MSFSYILVINYLNRRSPCSRLVARRSLGPPLIYIHSRHSVCRAVLDSTTLPSFLPPSCPPHRPIKMIQSTSFPFQRMQHQSPFLFPPALTSSHFHTKSNSSFQLPRTLDRPPFVEVSRFNIQSLAPNLADIPPEYSRRKLCNQAPQCVFFSLSFSFGFSGLTFSSHSVAD